MKSKILIFLCIKEDLGKFIVSREKIIVSQNKKSYNDIIKIELFLRV